MKESDTLVEFSIVPIGHTEHESTSQTVAKVAKLIKHSPLSSEIHSMGTVIEGPLDECMDLLKNCLREALTDVPRVTASINIDVRPGHPGRIQGNVRSIEEKLAS